MHNGFNPNMQEVKTLYEGGADPIILPSMKIRPNWRELLAALVGEQERAPIARRAKLNPTFIRDVLERGQNPKLENAEKLSQALGVPLSDWFLQPEAVNRSVSTRENPGGSPENSVRIDLMPRDFPVFGTGNCGEDGAFELNAGEAIDFVRRPPRLVGIKDAYALYVQGSSMRPWREEGQLVYVHPGQPPQIGDYVVVQCKPSKSGETPRAFIKRLERRTGTELVVSQYAPAGRMTFKLSQVLSVHRIVDWTELLGI